MSLKSTLVPIFLFISAVLAGYHPEQQRPRLLHRVEEAIDGTLDDPVIFWPTWAGAVWAGNRDTFTHASGVFAIPEVLGRVNSGLSIGVGLGSHACKSMAWAEIYITIADSVGGISAQPYVRFWNPINSTMVDQPLDISRGHIMNITVQAISPTTVFFVIENVSTQRSWSGELDTPMAKYPLCGESAEWFTITSTVDDIPYATVNFTNFLVTASEDLSKQPPTAFQYQQNVSVTLAPQNDTFTISYSG